MFNQLTNVPVGCQICGATAYGRESSSRTSDGVLHECVWICSRCGGVAKRHSELIRDQNGRKEEKTDRTGS